MLVNARDIQAAVMEIARRFRPERIILFGSYAYGRPTADSDVDLLILVKGERVHDRAIRVRAAIDFPFPVDLIVRSCNEFQRRIAWGDFFLREIQEKGIILYDASDARMGEEGGRRLRNRTARAARKEVAKL
jgi:predicted nucleotidyltransferase